MEQYQFVCRTDPYNASRNSGFDKRTGIKVLDTFSTLKEANEALFTSFRRDADKYFANWGLACAFVARPDSGFFNAGTNSDGCRFYTWDIWQYFVREHNSDYDGKISSVCAYGTNAVIYYYAESEDDIRTYNLDYDFQERIFDSYEEMTDWLKERVEDKGIIYDTDALTEVISVLGEKYLNQS